MNTPLLSVVDLGKGYPASADPKVRLGALGRALLGIGIPRIPVLSGVSFDVKRGESLGIIGENGAGKSTLLKLISGVLQPTEGQVSRVGSIGALLELGAGFDTELTGRDNIALAAGLMGLSPADIAEKRESIIAFADIGRYIEEPVKHYSSGMTVRLGFAVIAATRPDLLITDEVLAVGDESFQKKCVRWIEDYLDGGGTLLLVSHSMYHVQKLCQHALWLKDGRAEAYGDVFDVTQDYLAFHERKQAGGPGDIDADYSGGEYRISRASINGAESEAPTFLKPGEVLQVEVDIYSPDGRAPVFGFGVIRADGTAIYGSTSEIDGVAPAQQVDDKHWRFRLTLDAAELLPGGYLLRLHAVEPEGVRLHDTVARGFSLRGRSREFGHVRLKHHWDGPA
ncbi:MAG: ABC transporter ATP-binding protein [Lysobacteraceae bacterium]